MAPAIIPGTSQQKPGGFGEDVDPKKTCLKHIFLRKKKVNFPTAKSAQSEMAVNLTHHDVQRMAFGN